MHVMSELESAAERRNLRFVWKSENMAVLENESTRVTVYLDGDTVDAVMCETPDTSDVIRFKSKEKYGTVIEPLITDDALIFRIVKPSFTAEIRL